MKTFLFFLLISLPLGAARADDAAGPGHAVLYQCAMHPWIKSDKPGKCTICGMDLVLAPAGGAAVADANLVVLSPASASVVGVRTAEVKRASLVRTLRVAGIIDDDDTRHRFLTTRVPGRVEKLFVNYLGAEVVAGAPLAVVSSPAVLTAERVYVERLKAGPTAFTAAERAAAREQLLELDLTEEDIASLEQSMTPSAIITLRAPMAGTVVTRWVYEGQQLNKDQAAIETRLFEIADFSSMWFVFDAHESDLAWLRAGQTVDITTPSQPGVTLTAPIAFIDPTLNEMTRTARVRVVLGNHDHRLLHKQTAFGGVQVEQPDVLAVPRSAVLQHGGGTIVFVDRGDHRYESRAVQLGRFGDELVEVLAGLNTGDRVVTEGGLILDSQAQLAHAGEPAARPPQP
jgi:Cu(I)/Ag(I) efflux system membrane fusion protein